MYNHCGEHNILMYSSTYTTGLVVHVENYLDMSSVFVYKWYKEWGSYQEVLAIEIH